MLRAWTGTRAALLGALLLVTLLVVVTWLAGPPSSRPPRPTALRPIPTQEPLVPTRLPASLPTATPRPASVALPLAGPPPVADAPDDGGALGLLTGPARARIGVGLAVGQITDYPWGEGLPGWYLNWWVSARPSPLPETRFAQMVRINGMSFRPELPVIEAAARANPGSLWLLGNEPDVAWQDNATSEQYATVYQELYYAIKESDPTAQVAVAGVSQPTPLRMAYLDRILAAYRTKFGTEMPVDVWNIHAFILREERDAWGVGIPPGMAEDQGLLYEIVDHADLAIFRQQIGAFRDWMAERGFRDKPLIVSEYGILMPDSYGFPPDLVAGFMIDTFDFFLTARDAETGYPADDNRLVQAFCWYSIADTGYATPNLFDPGTRAHTPVGEVFAAYVVGLR